MNHLNLCKKYFFKQIKIFLKILESKIWIILDQQRKRIKFILQFYFLKLIDLKSADLDSIY